MVCSHNNNTVNIFLSFEVQSIVLRTERPWIWGGIHFCIWISDAILVAKGKMGLHAANTLTEGFIATCFINVRSL